MSEPGDSIEVRLERLEQLVRQLLARTELAELPLDFAIGLMDRQSLARQRGDALKALKEAGG